jgi:type I restriction enzyme S subunit
MVPNGWKVKTLDAANIVVTDGDRGKEYPKSSEFTDNGYCLFLSAKNVTKNGFSFSKKQFITKDKHLKLRKGLVNRGEIILTTRGTVGQFSYYDSSVKYELIRINSGMVTLSCSKAEVSSNFLYALSKSEIIKKQIDLAAFGSAQPQLTVKIIKLLKLPIPPSNEQRKIATILETWDKAISISERLIDNSKQQKKSLAKQLLTGEKRFAGFESDWEAKTLSDVCEMKAGKFVKASEILVDRQDETYPCYGGNGLRGYTRTQTNYGTYSLIGRQGALCGNITLAHGKFHATEHAVVVIPTNLANTKWLYYMLIDMDLNQYATGQAQPGLSVKNLVEVSMKIPTEYLEQEKIALVLTNADKEIDLLEQQLADLKQEKKALMQQLLTGKRRVNVDEGEAV